jgi:hypothetical protein
MNRIKSCLVLDLISLGYVFCLSEYAHAQMKASAYPEDPEELVLLPRYCQVRIMDRNRVNTRDKSAASDAVMAEGDKWSNNIGPATWSRLHHYCAALNWINRYKKTFFSPNYPLLAKDRQLALNLAMSEFSYIRKHMERTCVLYPELLLKEAFVYSELNNNNFILNIG